MDIVRRLKHEFSGNALKDVADQVRVYVKERHEAADKIEQLRKDKAELLKALSNIADGPRDVEKSYLSLLHEVRYEARAAIAKAIGGE